MALFHGKQANILWDAEVGASRKDYVVTLGQSWSVDATQDVTEITSMQDTWQTFVGGFNDWTATVECLLDAAGVKILLTQGGSEEGLGDVYAMIELYFLYSTNLYRMLYGRAVCTGVKPSGDKDSAPKVTYTFQGVNTLAWYAAAAKKTY